MLGYYTSRITRVKTLSGTSCPALNRIDAGLTPQRGNTSPNLTSQGFWRIIVRDYDTWGENSGLKKTIHSSQCDSC